MEDMVEAEAHPSFMESGAYAKSALPPSVTQACFSQKFQWRCSAEVVHVAHDECRHWFSTEVVAYLVALLGASLLAFAVYFEVFGKRLEVAEIFERVAFSAEVVGADEVATHEANQVVVHREDIFVGEGGEGV